MTKLLLAIIILAMNLMLGLAPLYFSQQHQDIFTIYTTFLIGGVLGGWFALLPKYKNENLKTISQEISRVVCVTIITLLVVWIPEIDRKTMLEKEWIGILFTIALLVLPTASRIVLLMIDRRKGFVTFGHFIAFVLFLNFSTWLLIGKPLSLAYGDKDVEVRHFQGYSIDTLYIDNYHSEDSWMFNYVDDFRPSVIEKFNENLNRNFTTIHISVDSLLRTRDSYEETYAYFVRVVSFIPFYLYMEHDIFAGSNSVGSDSYHLWFFKWIKLKEVHNRSA